MWGRYERVEPYLEPITTPGGDFTNGAAVIRGGNWEQPEKTFIRWAEASRGRQVENTLLSLGLGVNKIKKHLVGFNDSRI